MGFNEKQTDILLAAEKLFTTQGFDSTSVRDIATEANVNVAMINYYFGSKDGLLDSFFEWRIPDFMIDTEELSLMECSLEKIDKMIEKYIKAMNSHREIYRFIAIESSLKRRMLLSEPFSKLKIHNLNTITTIINEGIAKGVFSANNNPTLIHSMMMGTFMNFQMNQVFLQEQLGIESDDDYGIYIETTLTHFIQTTIKALLTYEISM